MEIGNHAKLFIILNGPVCSCNKYSQLFTYLVLCLSTGLSHKFTFAWKLYGSVGLGWDMW